MRPAGDLRGAGASRSFTPNGCCGSSRDFILFTRTDDELSKVVLRPHQMRAVDKVVERAAETGATAWPGLAHPGVGQDVHDDHRRQEAHRDRRYSRTRPF